MNFAPSVRILILSGTLLACKSEKDKSNLSPRSDANQSSDDGGGSDGGPNQQDAALDGCALVAHTSEADKESPKGCQLLDRDTSGCEAERARAGLTGYWLQFSCRVELSVVNTGGKNYVRASSDGLPDYLSNYFPSSDDCYEVFSEGIQNPNKIAAQAHVVDFPMAPDTAAQNMMSAIVGLSLNGVPIFGNFAAPGDDIYQEAMTFDRCGAHPQGSGVYHYHGEPYSISYDDNRFIGVLRDGYPVYGRRDPDNSIPSVDMYGGHTGPTLDSPNVDVYHYHLNEQTSANPGSTGQKQWFLTKGKFRGKPAPCAMCN